MKELLILTEWWELFVSYNTPHKIVHYKEQCHKEQCQS